VGRRERLGWTLLLGLELVYLATLQSRTAYLALAVSALLALVVGRARHLHREGERGRLAPRGAAAVLALGAVLVVLVASLHPGARGRLATMGRILASPASYLETDRGLYLRATWSMVREHPFGVGLGDWQTHYPLHRPREAFGGPEDLHRVRRAHSDHVQMLGELGWQGLAAWWAVLGTALVLAGRSFWRSGRRRRSPPP
jgi:O-antigen ligase